MPQDPTAPEPRTLLPRRGLERLDLLLLSVEALDLNGGEAMVWMSEQMGFTSLFPNRARQARLLVQALSLGSGVGGFERLRASLLDAQS